MFECDAVSTAAENVAAGVVVAPTNGVSGESSYSSPVFRYVAASSGPSRGPLSGLGSGAPEGFSEVQPTASVKARTAASALPLRVRRFRRCPFFEPRLNHVTTPTPQGLDLVTRRSEALGSGHGGLAGSLRSETVDSAHPRERVVLQLLAIVD